MRKPYPEFVDTRITGYRAILNTNFPVLAELRRTGHRRWTVTRGICNGTTDSRAVEFRTLKAARQAFDA